MKMFTKNLYRSIKTNIIRFITIMLIVMLGVAFYAGLTSASGYMRDLANDYYNNSNFYDVEISSYTGLDKTQAGDIVADLQSGGDDKTAFLQPFAELRAEVDGTYYLFRAMGLPEDAQLNLVIDKNGLTAAPLAPGEVYADSFWASSAGIKAGQHLDISGSRYIVAGLVSSSYYISAERGISSGGMGFDGFIYLNADDIIEQPAHYYTVFVRQNGVKDYFKSEYGTQSQEILADVKLLIENPENLSFSLAADNVGRVSYMGDCDRIQAIAVVFPVMFFLVAALVSLTNMTRLVESERTHIGLKRALGISSFSIIFSYILFAALATLAGALPGYFAGINLLPRLIIDAYSAVYSLPPISTPPVWQIALSSAGFILLSTTVPTLIVAMGTVRQQPAQLLRPKSPPAGKRILLERWKWLWAKLGFMQKVAVRNLFRYKTRVLLMLVGIIGATSLLVVAYGLRDSVGAVTEKQFGKIIKYDYVVQGMPGQDIYSQLDNSGVASNYTAVNMQSIKIKGTSVENIFMVIPENPEDFLDFFGIYNYKTGEQLQIEKGQGIITRQIAEHLKIKAGDSLSLIAGEDEFSITVSAIAENYLSHYVFLHTDDYPQSQANSVLVSFNDFAKPEEVQELSKTLLENPNVMYVTNLKEDGQKTFENTINTLSIVILAINLFAMALSFIVMFSLTNIGIEERKRELATLKVLGFFNGQTAMYMYRESAIMTVIAALIGGFAGKILLGYVFTTAETMAFMFVRDFAFTTYLYPFMLICAFYIAVNFIMFFRIRKIDMVSALKAAE